MEQKNLSADTKIIPNYCDKTKNQLSKVKKGELTSPGSQKRIVKSSSPPEPKVAKKNLPTLQKGLSGSTPEAKVAKKNPLASKRTSEPLSPDTKRQTSDTNRLSAILNIVKENQNQGPIEGRQSCVQ
jgi:hypothetical protein